MKLKTKEEILASYFMDANDAYVLLDRHVGINRCRKLLREMKEERDDEGELIIEPASMPPACKVIVPTKAFCNKFKIPMPRKKKDTSEASN